MTRTDMLTSFTGLTTGNTYNDLFGLVCNYICDADPDLVVAINRAISKVATTTVALTVPTTVLARARMSAGTGSLVNSSTF